MKNGYVWKEIEKGIVKGISMGMGAIMILLAVGSLIGTWIIAGTVPSMIYYGMDILAPSIFYFAACVICALTFGAVLETIGLLAKFVESI